MLRDQIKTIYEREDLHLAHFSNVLSLIKKNAVSLLCSAFDKAPNCISSSVTEAPAG